MSTPYEVYFMRNNPLTDEPYLDRDEDGEPKYYGGGFDFMFPEYLCQKGAIIVFCKPIKGKLTRSNYSDETEDRYRQDGYNRINYFVPFKKNSTELAWSKSVHYVARVYAESEEECIELYNYLIDNVIEFHQNAIDRAKADKITK